MHNYNEFSLAKEAILRGDLNTALNKFQSILEKYPNDLNVKLEISRLYMKMPAKLDKAESLLNELLSTKYACDALLELARLDVKRENYNMALKRINRILHIQYRPMAEVYKAKILMMKNELDEASVYFDHLLDNFESFDDVVKNRILVEYNLFLFEKGDAVKASNNLSLAYKKYGDDNILYALEVINERLGNYKEAIMYLKKLQNTRLDVIAKLKLVYLEIREKHYYQAYIYAKDLFSNKNQNSKYIIGHKEKHYIFFYLRFMLQMDISENEKYSYSEKQILNYNKDLALEHIRLHLKDDDTKDIHSVFNESVDIESLFYYAKEKIRKLVPYNIISVFDSYDIELDYIIGKTKGFDTNLFRVVSIPNTTNIIAMFPIENIKMKKIDLNDTSKVKTLKRISQIDKFNRKYNIDK